ncbi:MAG: hypothetical protein K0B07_02425 [DPANN group archaeon]|nr:hypothetical protein [DPANN group archaeon]
MRLEDQMAIEQPYFVISELIEYYDEKKGCLGKIYFEDRLLFHISDKEDVTAKDFKPTSKKYFIGVLRREKMDKTRSIIEESVYLSKPYYDLCQIKDSPEDNALIELIKDNFSNLPLNQYKIIKDDIKLENWWNYLNKIKRTSKSQKNNGVLR